MATRDPIRDWIDSLDETALGEWIAALTAKLNEVQAEYDLAMQAFQMKTRQALMDSAEHRRRRYRIGRAIPEAHLPIEGVPPPVGKTAQVLRAMGQHDRLRVWTTYEIRDDLVRYGWATSSDGDFASLLSTLSRMVKEGMIHRRGRGLYMIAPPEEAGMAETK
jgi:hypothetical protein